MTIDVKIIADSISEAGKRITTFQLRYQRFIHAELMTHRVFSRNASSSRAIPVAKMINQVRNDPAMPVHWGKNQAGMQAFEQLENTDAVKYLWLEAARNAADLAERMSEAGLHKQVANRILEPFQYISVVLTTTELDNWFELRAHADAQPEIRVLAKMMRDKLLESIPDILKPGEWHLPYVTKEEIHGGIADCLMNTPSAPNMSTLEVARNVSAARCCRVSYLKHDGTTAGIDEDLALCERLVGARPLHASPFEHQATPDNIGFNGWHNPELHGNFVGWIQNRKLIELEKWGDA